MARHGAARQPTDLHADQVAESTRGERSPFEQRERLRCHGIAEPGVGPEQEPEVADAKSGAFAVDPAMQRLDVGADRAAPRRPPGETEEHHDRVAHRRPA